MREIAIEKSFGLGRSGMTARYVYYDCTRSRDLNCKSGYIREEELVKQLIELIGQIDMNDSDIRKKFNEELKRVTKFHKTFLGIKQANTLDKEFNVKDYATYILREGTIIEKRELLSCLKSKIQLKNKIIRWLGNEGKIT